MYKILVRIISTTGYISTDVLNYNYYDYAEEAFEIISSLNELEIDSGVMYQSMHSSKTIVSRLYKVKEVAKEEVGGFYLDMLITDTGMGPATCNRLHSGGISTVKQLLEKSEFDLSTINNLTPKQLREIMDWLTTNGLVLCI